MAIIPNDIFSNLGEKIISNFRGMKKDDSRMVGMLGTVIIHLVAAIIFMTFQIRSVKNEDTDIFNVEFEEIPEESINNEELIELPAPSLEKILQGDNEMLNIARNLANQADPTIDPADYIDMVKEELIKSGQLDENNYIDEQKRMEQEPGEPLAMQNQKPEPEKEKDSQKSQELAANYQGPTRIYYDVPGRTHSYLPIPIYMCQGAGKITLSIEINQRGDIIDADLMASESTTNDPCLIETAVSTALMSKFNPDANAPRSQRGTLTYHFVAQ